MMNEQLLDIFKYDDSKSLNLLRQDLSTIKPTEKITIMIAMYDMKLIVLPWQVNLIRFLMGRKNFINFASNILCNCPGAVEDFWHFTMEQLERGYCPTDEKAAGGLNQAEFAIFKEILEVTGYQPSLNMFLYDTI